MVSIWKRLERGERCWPAEVVLRLAGTSMLYACAVIWRALCRLVGQPPHPSGPLEFIIAAGVCICLSAGLALTLEGSGLFRLLPMPPRAMLP